MQGPFERDARAHLARNGVLQFEGLTIEPAARRVLMGGREVPLSKTEFDLLWLLASNPDVVHTPQQVLEALWGTSWVGNGHAMEVQISRLRTKLGESSQQPKYIHTVRGVGYRFDALPQGPTVVLVYDEQLRITSIEPKGERLFGWDPDDLIGRFVLLVDGAVGDMSQRSAIQMMRAFAELGPATTDHTYEVRCADGSTVTKRALIEIFKNDAGEFTGARTTIR